MTTTTQETTMNAITQHTYGSPAVLELDAIDRPKLGAEDVLVRVHAAAVNPGDSHRMRGVPYIARVGYGLRKPRRTVLGTDLAGRVEAVGERVTRYRPGQEVFGWGEGTFAEYARVPEARLALKPANLTFEQAAAVPTAAFAALQGLRDRGRIRPGQQVLVVGASGGVGTFAVQIAKALGAHVTGVASTRNVDLVRSAGADRVIDYTREDFTRDRARYDLVVDTVGNRPLSPVVRVLAPTGTYVVVGAPNARSLTGMGRFARALLRSPFAGRRRLRPLFSTPSADDLATLRELLAAGKLLPVIDRHYDLADTVEALRHVEAGHARGKVVISLRAGSSDASLTSYEGVGR
jgi:NADPH:quinone reductase-like Zn-dependent oxidoreductase